MIELVEVRRGEHDAARRVAPRTYERREAGDGARRDAAARMALHAVVQADRRRLDRAVVARKLDDLLGLETADTRHALRRIFGEHPLFQPLVAKRVALDIVAVDETLAFQHVHQA